MRRVRRITAIFRRTPGTAINDYTNYIRIASTFRGGVDVSLERDWTVGMQAIYNHSAPKPGNALSWTEVYDASTAVLDSLLYSNSDKDTSSDRLNLNFHTDKVWDDKGKKNDLGCGLPA